VFCVSLLLLPLLHTAFICTHVARLKSSGGGQESKFSKGRNPYELMSLHREHLTGLQASHAGHLCRFTQEPPVFGQLPGWRQSADSDSRISGCFTLS